MKWFDERHYTIHVASDSSGFRWGDVLLHDRTLAPIEVGDFWEPVMLSKSIEIKEMLFNSIMIVNSCYKGLTLPFLLASTICS